MSSKSSILCQLQNILRTHILLFVSFWFFLEQHCFKCSKCICEMNEVHVTRTQRIMARNSHCSYHRSQIGHSLHHQCPKRFPSQIRFATYWPHARNSSIFEVLKQGLSGFIGAVEAKEWIIVTVMQSRLRNAMSSWNFSVVPPVDSHLFGMRVITFCFEAAYSTMKASQLLSMPITFDDFILSCSEAHW